MAERLRTEPCARPRSLPYVIERGGRLWPLLRDNTTYGQDAVSNHSVQEIIRADLPFNNCPWSRRKEAQGICFDTLNLQILEDSNYLSSNNLPKAACLNCQETIRQFGGNVNNFGVSMAPAMYMVAMFLLFLSAPGFIVRYERYRAGYVPASGFRVS